MRLFFVLLLGAAALEGATGYRAGVARIGITPAKPIWMAGYGSRTHPSSGKLTNLYAKALAIEDGKGGRIVIVTADLLLLPRALTEVVAARAAQAYGLDRASILFNASHTHTGPEIGFEKPVLFDLSATDFARVQEYTRQLSEDLFTVIGGALAELEPATLDYGFGEAGFAVNRRQPTPNGVMIGVNPQGPVDHRVPVVRVSRNNRLLAVLAGYACHNTTHTGDEYRLGGDYAGFAQAELEQNFPGTAALFLQLCAGDQNPEPRGTEDLARQHGIELAETVARVLRGKLQRIDGPLRTVYQVTQLRFAPHTRETFEEEAKGPEGPAARRARKMLAAYDAGRPVRSTPYPVQAVRFGKSLTLLALGGEVVVDYALRLRREYGDALIVAAYSNDVMGYIPSRRVLEEGGYEAGTNLIYYGQPGPFSDDVEDRLIEAARQALARVGLRRK